MLLIEKRRDVCSHPRSLESAGPAQPPLHLLLSTRAPPSHHTPRTSITALFLLLASLSWSSSHTAQAKCKTHPSQLWDTLGTVPPSPGRQALTHIVILEGMEKVASQLPVVSWSARGIANATYVVWRILWEMGRVVVSRSAPKMSQGQDTALPPQ